MSDQGLARAREDAGILRRIEKFLDAVLAGGIGEPKDEKLTREERDAISRSARIIEAAVEAEEGGALEEARGAFDGIVDSIELTEEQYMHNRSWRGLIDRLRRAVRGEEEA